MSLADYEHDMLERIDRFGYAVQYVAGETLERSWAYTVGLGRELEGPELVVTGRSPASSLDLLRRLVADIEARGVPTPGRLVRYQLPVDGVVHQFCYLAVDSDLAFRSSLLAIAHDLDLEIGPVLGAVQFVTCDGRGKMPWEVGCRGADAQPLLDHPLESVRRRFA